MTDIIDEAGRLEQLERDDSIARQRALAARRPKHGKSDCEDCDERIPADRREAEPGCTRCINCERKAEARAMLKSR